MAGSHETEDGQPRYGRRASPEELARILAEQGIAPVPDSATAVGRELEVQVVRVPGSSGSVSPPTRWDAPFGAPSPRQHQKEEAASEDGEEGQDRLLITIRRRRPRRRWRTLVLGLVLMLLVPFGLVSAAISLATDASGAQTTVLGDSGAVYLREGTRAMIYSGSQTHNTDCTVASPEGGAVVKDQVEEPVPFAVARFTAPVTGSYTVQCSGGTEGMVVGPPLRTDRIVAASVIIMGSLLCAVVGLAVTALGLSRAVAHRPRSTPPPEPGWSG